MTFFQALKQKFQCKRSRRKLQKRNSTKLQHEVVDEHAGHGIQTTHIDNITPSEQNASLTEDGYECERKPYPLKDAIQLVWDTNNVCFHPQSCHLVTVGAGRQQSTSPKSLEQKEMQESVCPVHKTTESMKLSKGADLEDLSSATALEIVLREASATNDSSFDAALAIPLPLSPQFASTGSKSFSASKPGVSRCVGSNSKLVSTVDKTVAAIDLATLERCDQGDYLESQSIDQTTPTMTSVSKGSPDRDMESDGVLIAHQHDQTHQSAMLHLSASSDLSKSTICRMSSPEQGDTLYSWKSPDSNSNMKQDRSVCLEDGECRPKIQSVLVHRRPVVITVPDHPSPYHAALRSDSLHVLDPFGVPSEAVTLIEDNTTTTSLIARPLCSKKEGLAARLQQQVHCLTSELEQSNAENVRLADLCEDLHNCVSTNVDCVMQQQAQLDHTQTQLTHATEMISNLKGCIRDLEQQNKVMSGRMFTSEYRHGVTRAMLRQCHEIIDQSHERSGYVGLGYSI